MLQHNGLTSFLDSLINANWDCVEADYEISEEDLLNWSNGELGLERKETVYFDIKQNKSTWDILKRGGKSIHYLQKAIVRAILSFANSGGGYVIVGVNDDEEQIGLKRDIEIVQNKYECSYKKAKDMIIEGITQELIIVINCLLLPLHQHGW